MSKKIKVLVVPSDRTGVSFFRSTKPHIALEQMYPDEFHVDIDYELTKYTENGDTLQIESKSVLDDDKWLSQYDIIHYHRTIGPYEKHAEVIERCNKLGIVTFMDIDDHWAPGPHHPAYLIIKNNGIDKKVVSNLQSASNIITTTPLFQKELQKVSRNENVFILPNAVDPSEKQFTPKPTCRKKKRRSREQDRSNPE